MFLFEIHWIDNLVKWPDQTLHVSNKCMVYIKLGPHSSREVRETHQLLVVVLDHMKNKGCGVWANESAHDYVELVHK